MAELGEMPDIIFSDVADATQSISTVQQAFIR